MPLVNLRSQIPSVELKKHAFYFRERKNKQKCKQFITSSTVGRAKKEKTQKHLLFLKKYATIQKTKKGDAYDTVARNYSG